MGFVDKLDMFEQGPRKARTYKFQQILTLQMLLKIFGSSLIFGFFSPKPNSWEL